MGDTLTRSHFRVEIIIPGIVGTLIFDRMTGGQAQTNVTKRARSGQSYRSSGLPGPGDISTIVAERDYDRDRDPALAAFLRPRAGEITGCRVNKIIMGPNRRPDPRYQPIRWRDCKFLDVAEPDPDSDSAELGVLIARFEPSSPGVSG